MKMQVQKIAALKDARDPQAAALALQSITKATTTEENLFPLILHAVKVNCTVGEIMNAMKSEFGTWMSPSGF